MSDRDSLKAGLAFGILPGNIQHVWLVFSIYWLKLLQTIAIWFGRLTIDNDCVMHYRLLCGEHALDCFESNVHL